MCQNVSLYYKRNAQFLFSSNKQLRSNRSHCALDDVSFSISKGEFIGVVGVNGSGKSSLARVCAGILGPDEGDVFINSKVQLLALGVGFKSELSGVDNALLSGAALGLSIKMIKEQLPEIARFAELEGFMNEPLRTYSSGMRSRLAFAVSTLVVPDVLILDEVLSTGDAKFRRKAEERMNKLIERSGSILLVSHSSKQLQNLCTRVLWLDKGRLLMDGEPEVVLKEYGKYCKVGL